MGKDTGLFLSDEIRKDIRTPRLEHIINSTIIDSSNRRDPLPNLDYTGRLIKEDPENLTISLVDGTTQNQGPLSLHVEHWIEALLGSKSVAEEQDTVRAPISMQVSTPRGSEVEKFYADITIDQATTIFERSIALYRVDRVEFVEIVKESWSQKILGLRRIGNEDPTPPPIVQYLLG